MITIVEVAVVLSVLGFLAVLLFPSMECSREAARRARCLNNLKQIGVQFQNIDTAQKRFPPACFVTENPAGGVANLNVPGWSWCVGIFPPVERKPLYEVIDLKADMPLSGSPSTVAALATPIEEYSCPSFSGERWVDPKTKAESITNYKVLGATHTASLAQATAIANPPAPGYEGDHPDGVSYPGSKHGSADCIDGTSQTVIICETTEQYYARWTIGVETILVGLPDDAAVFAEASSDIPYAHPVGYTKDNFWEKSTVTDNRTYLLWDYEDKIYDDRGVLSAPGGLVAPILPDFPARMTRPPKTIQIGPSSNHSGVINHLFADGSVQSISDDIDAAAYMFLITRDGGDPTPPLDY